jgi:hypothetical protein
MSDTPARENPAIDSDPVPSDSSPTHSPSSRNSPGLQIPEPRDGYFGYSEENSLRHVRLVISGIMIFDCLDDEQLAARVGLEMTWLSDSNFRID